MLIDKKNLKIEKLRPGGRKRNPMTVARGGRPEQCQGASIREIVVIPEALRNKFLDCTSP